MEIYSVVSSSGSTLIWPCSSLYYTASAKMGTLNSPYFEEFLEELQASTYALTAGSNLVPEIVRESDSGEGLHWCLKVSSPEIPPGEKPLFKIKDSDYGDLRNAFVKHCNETYDAYSCEQAKKLGHLYGSLIGLHLKSGVTNLNRQETREFFKIILSSCGLNFLGEFALTFNDSLILQESVPGEAGLRIDLHQINTESCADWFCLKVNFELNLGRSAFSCKITANTPFALIKEMRRTLFFMVIRTYLWETRTRLERDLGLVLGSEPDYIGLDARPSWEIPLWKDAGLEDSAGKALIQLVEVVGSAWMGYARIHFVDAAPLTPLKSWTMRSLARDGAKKTPVGKLEDWISTQLSR